MEDNSKIDKLSFENISMMNKVVSSNRNINSDNLLDNFNTYYQVNENYSIQTQEQLNEINSKQFKRKRRTAQSNIIQLHDIDLDNENLDYQSSYSSSYHYHGKVWNEEMVILSS